jgi:hypothetical protein
MSVSQLSELGVQDGQTFERLNLQVHRHLKFGSFD